MFERKIGQLAYSAGLGRILLTILKRVNIEREGWKSISFYGLCRIEVFGIQEVDYVVSRIII